MEIDRESRDKRHRVVHDSDALSKQDDLDMHTTEALDELVRWHHLERGGDGTITLVDVGDVKKSLAEGVGQHREKFWEFFLESLATP